MGVEMSTIFVDLVKDDVIYGWFRVKDYNDLRIEYELKNGVLSFSRLSKNKKKNELFSEWLLNEKEIYATFILNYFNEINKINNISSFGGKLIEEHPHELIDKEYILDIQFDELPTIVTLKLNPYMEEFKLLYQNPIPINSEGEYSKAIYIGDVLQYETIQRMWEPFRSKTKYRLELLHMLR